MNKKVSILTELGEVKFKKDWQNYLQYNFSEKDIPDIVDLIINEQKNIKNANEGDPIVWASLHAWRALGQLESPKAIQPLISQFNQLCGDDWALAEIEIVMGMIGEQAIEPIFLYLKDKRRNEFSRIMASSCLAEIALQNSPLREVVIEKFRQYLIKPDSKSRALNGLIITRLEKLKATELINEIRQLFINDVVDNLACGDIEDVEISLGLRDKRETPKPKYGALSGLFPEDGGEAETEHDRLRDMLIKYGNEESIFNSSELDGYFASIACSPVLIQPSQWMPLIWGENDHQPEWKDQAEVQEYLDLLMSHYNEVIDDFQYNDYEPLYLETDVTGKTELIVTGWCAGFMRGSLLWLTKEFRSDPVLKKLLKLFIPFLSDDEEILERYSIEIIKDYQSLIEPQVNDLYQHFFEQRLPPEVEQSFIRDIPKVGRNDSCPCGSGKKFKKCCLH